VNNTNYDGVADIYFNYTNGLTSLINNSAFNNYINRASNFNIYYSNVTIENSMYKTTSGLYCNITTQCITCNVYITGLYTTLGNFFPCNSCINCNEVCNGGYCACNTGFERDTSCNCLSGYFGQQCQKCNCGNGNCTDGINGNGSCTAESQSSHKSEPQSSHESESQSSHKSHSSHKLQSSHKSHSSHISHSGAFNQGFTAFSKKLTFLELFFSLPFLLIIFICT